MNLLFLLLTLFAGFNEQHKHLVIAERYDESVLVEGFCNQTATFHCYRAIAHFKTKDYVKAHRSVKTALETGNLSERHQVLMDGLNAILVDLAKNPDKMIDIATDMDVLERRLRQGKGGSKTQEIQKNVVRKLDEQIKDLEDQMQQANTSGGGQAKSQAPASDSKIMKGAGEGNVENKKLILTNEVWGKMPAKDKVKALEAINKQLPPHIREAAEGFSKKLSERK